MMIRPMVLLSQIANPSYTFRNLFRFGRSLSLLLFLYTRRYDDKYQTLNETADVLGAYESVSMSLID